MTDNAALCEDPAIYYSRRDTVPTIKQIQEHNEYRHQLGCPK